MKELSIDEMKKKKTISNKIMSINDLPWHKSVINYSNTAFFRNSFNTLHFTGIVNWIGNENGNKHFVLLFSINMYSSDKWVNWWKYYIYFLGFVNIIELYILCIEFLLTNNFLLVSYFHILIASVND